MIDGIFWLIIGGAMSGGLTFFITNKIRLSALSLREASHKEVLQSTIIELQAQSKEVLSSLHEREQFVREQEVALTDRQIRLGEQEVALEANKKRLTLLEWQIEQTLTATQIKREELVAELSRIAELSPEEARKKMLKDLEVILETDMLGLFAKQKKDVDLRTSEYAREILIKSIGQYAAEVTAETTQTIIHLESDDIKGKLIGKEGRNIIAFERATGVSLIIDDTPDTVFISSFDLFRRYIAKKSLEALILDKRIQPARIEEIVLQNQTDADKLIYELGAKTVQEMEVTGIPDEILPLIWKFRFRTSYGQNILLHSKEVAYIAESIARLIGADTTLAFKGWLLHDLGKSLDHDIEGTHPELGGKIARKYGLDEKLVNIIEGHHDWVPQICIETKIVQIADAISAIRPGARRMNADEYLTRVSEMENIAMSFSGVSRAFALSAGREVRVFVDALTISDIEAARLARDIAVQIEENLTYPGEIKVNLIRETRVIEYAR